MYERIEFGAHCCGQNVYLQVDRLGRPGIKEIFEPFADHASSDRAIPTNDAVLKNDIATVTGTSSTASTLLTPDELQLNLGSTATSASYLALELNSGSSAFGGRGLSDDVMTSDLQIAYGTFGNIGTSTNANPCLQTDNVAAPAANTLSSSSTFPYLATPH